MTDCEHIEALEPRVTALEVEAQRRNDTDCEKVFLIACEQIRDKSVEIQQQAR